MCPYFSIFKPQFPGGPCVEVPGAPVGGEVDGEVGVPLLRCPSGGIGLGVGVGEGETTCCCWVGSLGFSTDAPGETF